MPDVIVRRGRIDDYAVINALIQLTTTEGPLVSSLDADLDKWIQSCWVAEVDSVTVGVCGLEPDDEGESATLHSLVVAEGFRRRGIGRRLVEVCQAEARRRGVRSITALTLYPQYFEPLGFHGDAFKQLPVVWWSPEQGHEPGKASH
jgi:amino-acid N-acetyltransferase